MTSRIPYLSLLLTASAACGVPIPPLPTDTDATGSSTGNDSIVLDGTSTAAEGTTEATEGSTSATTTTASDTSSTDPDPSSSSAATEATTGSTCGDGTADVGEACDGEDLGGATCEGEGFTRGALACTPGCTLDTSGCQGCGDEVLDRGEECDTFELGGQTCETQGFDAGILGCTDRCTFDTSVCYLCGNGALEPGEVCEGADLDGQTCETQGFDGGVLGCTDACTLDVAGCTSLECGNGVIDPGEDCDGVDLVGQTCVGLGQGYTGGVLACSGACELNVTGCTPTYTVDFCRLQFPLVIDATPATNVTVYGRLYAAGLTDQSVLNDPAAAMDGWVGYGPDGSDPSVDAGWVWIPAVPNPGWNGAAAGEPNNDEYQAALVVPAVGLYDYAYRFSGNSGGTFTYCDGDPGGSTTGYAPASAGQLTSAP